MSQAQLHVRVQIYYIKIFNMKKRKRRGIGLCIIKLMNLLMLNRFDLLKLTLLYNTFLLLWFNLHCTKTSMRFASNGKNWTVGSLIKIV